MAFQCELHISGSVHCHQGFCRCAVQDFTCSKSTIEAPEKGVKYVQS